MTNPSSRILRFKIQLNLTSLTWLFSIELYNSKITLNRSHPLYSETIIVFRLYKHEKNWNKASNKINKWTVYPILKTQFSEMPLVSWNEMGNLQLFIDRKSQSIYIWIMKEKRRKRPIIEWSQQCDIVWQFISYWLETYSLSDNCSILTSKDAMDIKYLNWKYFIIRPIKNGLVPSNFK